MGVAARTAGFGKRLLPGQLPAAAPTPPIGTGPIGGQNDPIGLMVELFLNGAWTDISPFVFYRGSERVVITRGRPNETSAIQPQTCTFTINNRDGRFSPRNPVGPYYGQIGRNTPVRVSRMQNGIRRYRFYGEVPSWPTTWDISGTDVFATVTAAGQMRRLFQGNLPLRSALYRGYALGFSAALKPVGYWPCEDGANSASIASGLTGGLPMLVSGTPTFASNTAFACSASLPLLNGSTWTAAIPSGAVGGDNILRFLLSIPAGGAFDTGVIARIYTTGTVARLDLQYGVANSGSLTLIGYSAGRVQLFTTTAAGFNGVLSQVSMELTNASPNTNYNLASLSVVSLIPTQPGGGGGGGGGSSGTLTGSVTGIATQVVINPDGHITDTAVGHVVYQSKFDTLSNSSSQLIANINESPAFRFSRLCTEQSVPAAVIAATGVNAGDPTTLGFQLNDTFANLIQQPAASSGGLLFEARDQAALILRERGTLYNQAPKLTLDHSLNQLSGPLDPVDDDALTRNDITVTRVGGSSNQQALTSGTLSNQPPPAGVGDYPTSPGLSLAFDSLLPDHAGWRLHLGTVDQPRFPKVQVNLRHSTFTSNLDLMNAALTIDIGDRLVVVNPPPWMPPDQISQIVQGYSEIMGVFEHDMTLNCVPEDPYKVGLLDDTVLGHVDTDGSTLAAAYGATDVTLLVATTNASSPLWTTSGGDFPFDIAVGGERMTVTNITGATSPQMFTVTRSVNGVVKAQLANTDVRLWQPMYLSL